MRSTDHVLVNRCRGFMQLHSLFLNTCYEIVYCGMIASVIFNKNPQYYGYCFYWKYNKKSEHERRRLGLRIRSHGLVLCKFHLTDGQRPDSSGRSKWWSRKIDVWQCQSREGTWVWVQMNEWRISLVQKQCSGFSLPMLDALVTALQVTRLRTIICVSA